MNEDEFIRKYRGRFLLFLTEAWSCRKMAPSDLGLLVDAHSLTIEALLRDIHKKHIAQPVPKPPVKP